MAGYYDSIGINNYFQQYANDPAFLQALNSYNPNFRATQNGYAQVDPQTGYYTAPQDNTYVANIPTTMEYATSEEGGSSNGLFYSALTAAGIFGGCLIAGKGHPITGAKKIWSWLGGKLGLESKKTAEAVTSKFTAQRVNGKNVYTIPEKTTTIDGADKVKKYASENGISLGKNRTGFRSGNSQITKCEFKYEPKEGADKGKSFTVKFSRNDDGFGFDILNSKGKSVKEAWAKDNKKALEEVGDRVTKIGEGKVEGNFGAFRGLNNVEYTTKAGDDVFTVARTDISAKRGIVGGVKRPEREVKKMTTLERFKEDSDVVKKYFEENPTVKEKFLAESLKQGKLPEGMQVGKFSKVIDGKKFYFENGELKGIEVQTKNKGLKRLKQGRKKLRYYSAGSIEYKEIMKQENIKSEVDKLIKDVYTDKTLIPEGATIYIS